MVQLNGELTRVTSELAEIGHLKSSTTAEVSRDRGREGGVVLIKKFPVACGNNEVANKSTAHKTTLVLRRAVLGEIRTHDTLQSR